MGLGLLAGIYIERDRVRLIVARLDREHVEDSLIDPVVVAEGQAVFLKEKDWKTGREALDLAVGALKPMAAEIVGAAVASYGPFVSLDRGGDDENRDPRYGELDPDRADPPFAGLNSARFVEDELRRLSGRPVPVMAQTDAAAGALGEAWYRNIGPDEMIAYLILDQGIGGGWVTGRQILSGALHPEAGLSSVTVHPLDPLKRDRRYRKATSVTGLARLAAMVHRAEVLGYDFDTIEAMLKTKDEQLWTPFHNYVAQLCLTCTAILSPNKIVLGGLLSKSLRCLPQVRAEFEQMWVNGDRGPTVHHGALGDDAYISGPVAGRDIPSDLAGTVYLAYKAAGYGSIRRLRSV